jgi:hypothetical protein
MVDTMELGKECGAGYSSEAGLLGLIITRRAPATPLPAAGSPLIDKLAPHNLDDAIDVGSSVSASRSAEISVVAWLRQ